MDINFIPEPNFEDQKYEREQTEKQEREKQSDWLAALAWPPIAMVAESLAAEGQCAEVGK